jgi:2-polyprenyl-3-methyl-5-hydroxy-6-metoxy-1,4-benzoquinol methylase
MENIPRKFFIPKKDVTKELVVEFYDWVVHGKVTHDPSMALLDEYTTTEKVVLDLGCGVGRESEYFSSKGVQVVGIDISKKSINEAWKNNVEYPDYATFTVDDISSMDLKRLFNIVILHDVLEHVFEADQEKTLVNAINHTARSGVIFIKCPTEEYRIAFCSESILEGHHVNPGCFQILDEMVSLDMVKRVFKENGVELL